MSNEPKITFFDISSKLTPQAWSPSTWKARFVLNYKRLPYKTVWVSYPDIEGLVTKYGGRPTRKHLDDTSKPLYTLPAILDETGGKSVFLTDSWDIAEYLDQNYPERPVFPTTTGKAMLVAFKRFLENTYRIGPVLLLMVGPTPALLDDRGSEYYRITREHWFGRPLAERSPVGPVRDGHWKEVKEGLDKVAKVLEKNAPGAKWVAGGNEPTFVDFIIAAEVLWLRITLTDEWKARGVEQWNEGRWAKLLKNVEEWITVP